jgi:aryl-alcohol dehydrogenase-like predicted oxidoreductase
VVATKYTLFTRRDDPNRSGNHRKNMVQSLEESLRRLDTDYVDLYWVHAWDGTTPLEEILRGLDDLARQGKILYAGISDTPAWVVSRANALADLRGWTPFTALQIRYSLIDRAAERDLLPMARALDLGVTPWSVLGAGVLSGKYNRDRAAVGRAREKAGAVERNLRIAGVVLEVASELGVPSTAVALAWARQQKGVLVPLLGARNLEQLRENLKASAVTLTPDQMARLDAVSRIDLGFPHDFLADPAIRDLMFGGTQDRLENHRE